MDDAIEYLGVQCHAIQNGPIRMVFSISLTFRKVASKEDAITSLITTNPSSFSTVRFT